MMRTDARAQLRLAVDRLLRDNHGQLPRASALSLAAAFQIAERTVYRQADACKQLARQRAEEAACPAAPSPGTLGHADSGTVGRPETPALPYAAPATVKWWEDDDLGREVREALGGSPTVQAAWHDLHRDGVATCSYPTFTRQLRQHLPPAVHAGLTAHGRNKGRLAYVDASTYCTEVTTGRNTRWQADVQHLPIRVRTDNGTEVSGVYMTTFLDEATRMVMAFTLTMTAPTGEDVAATLAAAVTGHTDPVTGTFVGGLPESIRWDNGGEFLNEAVAHACVRLGVIPVPSPPYSGWRKGKIERFHLTSQQQFFATLVGSTQGPATFTGQRPWRGPDGDLLFFSALVTATTEWVAQYNDENVHSSLGRTPRQAWVADPVAVRRAPAAALHPLMLALPKHRVVAKDGISYANTKYLAPALANWRRRKVEVRVLPHDVDRIWVFDPATGDLICEAVPAARMSLTNRQRLLRQRDADYRDVRAAIIAGTERRRQNALVAHVLEAEEELRTEEERRRRRGTPDSDDRVDVEPANDERFENELLDAEPDLIADANAFIDLMGDDQ